MDPDKLLRGPACFAEFHSCNSLPFRNNGRPRHAKDQRQRCDRGNDGILFIEAINDYLLMRKDGTVTRRFSACVHSRISRQTLRPTGNFSTHPEFYRFPLQFFQSENIFPQYHEHTEKFPSHQSS